MTPQELVAYYQALLIIQYARLPKAKGTVGAFITEAVASMIINQVRAAFNLKTAVGAQLDAMATYRGATRHIFGLDITKTYFSFLPVGGVPAEHKGFSLAAEFDMTSWYWLTVQDFSSEQFTLNDGELRQLISYLAAVQSLFHSVADIDLLLEQFFGDYVTMADNGDMSLTYTHDLTDPNLLFAFVDELGVLPRPAGVSVSVVEV